MIVNFQRRFVFVHIPKTGGSSIAAALSTDAPDMHQRVHRVCAKLGLPAFRKHLAGAQDTKHETYQQFINRFEGRTGLPQSVAYSLRPVAFVRHPVSRFISLHRYLLAKHANTYPEVPADINAWAAVVRDGTAPYLERIRSLLTQSTFIEGVQQECFLGRFETLEQDIVKLGAHIRTELHLKHLNQSAKRPASKSDWQGLSEKNLSFLREKYADDFVNFGYSAE
ncbi:sulfotransferase family 2 domain-containing protein [Yoonia sp. BS5-3]|uniref:Sulfotransferase family 2 domain-containing protein n=1 Tax=Yoonia phaeophyticola TaxID=3137369 RepID=A0ABZ2V0X1_9RHOB